MGLFNQEINLYLQKHLVKTNTPCWRSEEDSRSSVERDMSRQDENKQENNTSQARGETMTKNVFLPERDVNKCYKQTRKCDICLTYNTGFYFFFLF